MPVLDDVLVVEQLAAAAPSDPRPDVGPAPPGSAPSAPTAAPATDALPVFVDGSGRRRRLLAAAALAAIVGCVSYVGMVAFSLAGVAPTFVRHLLPDSIATNSGAGHGGRSSTASAKSPGGVAWKPLSRTAAGSPPSLRPVASPSPAAGLPAAGRSAAGSSATPTRRGAAAPAAQLSGPAGTAAVGSPSVTASAQPSASASPQTTAPASLPPSVSPSATPSDPATTPPSVSPSPQPSGTPALTLPS